MAREELILAIDEGTTSVKVLLMSRAGKIVSRASRPLSISFPRPGWVEQDAAEIWLAVMAAVNDCLKQAGAVRIAGIGISNQRESVVAWDADTGKPAGPCISWQCRRTAQFCEQLRDRGLDEFFHQRSGLALDPLFSGAKFRWLLDQVDQPKLRLGTVDSWLLWNLTGGAVHATDMSNAARTQLFNLQRLEWDSNLLDLFGIPAAYLPEIRPSSSIFGYTVECEDLPAGLPVASLVGDSHAALFGHCEFELGTVKATYGTGSSLMMLMDSPVLSTNGLSTTVAWAEQTGVRYALEGNITNTGAAVQWAGELLGVTDTAQDTARLAASVPDSGGVYLVPAFAGLGAPYWDAEARGLIFGLTRGSTRAHIARAAVDSIAFQVLDVFEAMQLDSGSKLPSLRADGGATRNDQLMQFQADLLDCPVVRSSSPELSARGAAWLAGLAVGFWNSHAELKGLAHEGDSFLPRLPKSRRSELLTGWHDARRRALSGRRVNSWRESTNSD